MIRCDDSSKTLQIIESVPETIDWNKLIISPREVSNDLYHKSLSQMHGLLTEYKDFVQDEDESVEILLLTILDEKLEWEGFNDFIEKCENYVVIKARRAIFKKLDGTDNQAAITQRWVLKNKRPDEF